MHVAIGVLCVVLLVVLLTEFFIVFLLPRRVKRDPRLARGTLRALWRPWQWVARRLPRTAEDTTLGVVDASAFSLAFGPEDSIEGARMTFRLGRHALADLAHALTSGRLVARPDRERLSEERLNELLQRLEGSGLHAEERGESRKRLEHLRGSYELYAFTISRQLALELPDWVPEEGQENWRAATQRGSRGRLL